MQSISNFKWLAKLSADLNYSIDPEKSFFINQFLGIRYGSDINVDNFFNPKIKNQFPNISDFKDLEKAINFLSDAVKKKKKIMIFADYDVDGATSSAVLKLFLDYIGASHVDVYVPDRIKEGYGPSKSAFQQFAKDGYELVITVDCGIVAFDEINFAKTLGMDVIVIDHHISDSVIPEALAVVDPNRKDNDNEFGYLCGAGVAFVVCSKLARFFYKEFPDIKSKLFSLLELVAIGTICDVVPLVGLNRAIVSQGLEMMQNTKNTGIKALLDYLGNPVIETELIGFKVGPLINAAGRIGKSNLGSKLFTSQNYEEAIEIAAQLNDYNEERKEIEKKAINEINETKANYDGKHYVFEYSERWHEGVIGIVASRVKDKTGLVSIIGNESNVDGEGVVIKCSCRSNGIFDVGDAILRAQKKGLLIKGGGHFAAGGFSVCSTKIKELKVFFDECFIMDERAMLKTKERHYDLDIFAATVNDLSEDFAKLEPFGMKNEKPILRLRDIDLNGVSVMKDIHIRVKGYCKISKRHINAVWFNLDDNKIDKVRSLVGNKIDLICRIGFREYRGKIYDNIIIEDIIPIDFGI